MIKRTLAPTPPRETDEPDWLPLEDAAEVEITSEAAGHPIEAAFTPGDERDWRAETSGAQTIRLLFREPRPVKHVRLVIEEHDHERTQQLELRAASVPGGPWRELVRQQYNFSPGGATREQEDYPVGMRAVAALELRIVPDLRGGDARASLQQFRVA